MGQMMWNKTQPSPDASGHLKTQINQCAPLHRCILRLLTRIVFLQKAAASSAVDLFAKESAFAFHYVYRQNQWKDSLHKFNS